jgi:hypothetical protein
MHLIGIFYEGSLRGYCLIISALLTLVSVPPAQRSCNAMLPLDSPFLLFSLLSTVLLLLLRNIQWPLNLDRCIIRMLRQRKLRVLQGSIVILGMPWVMIDVREPFRCIGLM